MNIKLQKYNKQIKDFPFLEKYIKNLIHKNFEENISWIINDLPFENHLIDIKINFIRSHNSFYGKS